MHVGFTDNIANLCTIMCHRNSFTIVFEAKMEENMSKGMARHRQCLVSSIACVYQDHVLLWAHSPPIPFQSNVHLAKAVYTTGVTGGKEGTQDRAVNCKCLVDWKGHLGT
jgi:hypothetical protein